MNYIHSLLTLPIGDPVLIFSIVLLIILLSPIVFDRLHIPHIVGLILSGVLLGPHGLHVLDYDSSFVLLGQVGVLYIMFLAGVDMDMNDLRQNRGRSLVFGIYTFLIPLIIGLITSIVLVYFIYTNMADEGGFLWVNGDPDSRMSLLKYCGLSAMVLSSMYSSNTLLAYPIAARFGVTKNRSVNITVGGTMITTVLALLLLAVSLEMAHGALTTLFWLRFIGSFTAFVFVLFFLYPRIGRYFFKHFDDPVMQYVFILAMVFLASYLAKMAGMEYILGAFMAGIALNPLVPKQSSLLSRIHFVGNSIFIPFFLISVGMVIDCHVFLEGHMTWITAIVMVLVATLTKYLAAVATRHTLKMTRDEGNMLFGLSNAHAAAALAVVVLGYNLIVGHTANGTAIRLLSEEVLGGTVLMILVSCTISSIVTQRAARKIALSEENINRNQYNPEHRILVPIAHLEKTQEMMDLAFTLMTRRDSQPIYALHVVDENGQNTEQAALSNKILERAKSLGIAAERKVKKISRYDLNIIGGITNVVLEKNISDVILGLHTPKDGQITTNNYFGPILEPLLGNINRTICVYKPVQPLNTIHRLVLYLPNNAHFESGYRKWCHRALVLARALGARMVVYGNEEELDQFKRQMKSLRMNVRTYFRPLPSWEQIPSTSKALRENDLLLFILARKNSLSYHNNFEHLPTWLQGQLSGLGFIVLYPEQFKEGEIDQTEEKSKII